MPPVWHGAEQAPVTLVSVDSIASPKERLVVAGVRLLERGGPEAVQARRLATEIGASTMAVYTHFGGMNGLWEAIVRAGFRRLAQHLSSVPATGDPIADVFALAAAYRKWAMGHGHLYRAMFTMTWPRRRRRPSAPAGGAVDVESLLAEAEAALDVMVGYLERLEVSGAIAAQTTVAAAGQFLATLHGYVLLEMAGYFGPGRAGVAWVLGPLVRSLLVGLGADRTGTERAATTLGVPFPPSS
jgi:AcrR family transcriptional regulator